MNCEVRVAVIMSVYLMDKLEYVKQAVLSIEMQSLPCDFYVMADGPITKEINDYLTTLTQRSRTINSFSVYYYTRKENKGLAFSLNQLIEHVLESQNNYSYIARMDADDISLPNRIQSQVNYLDSNKSVDVLGAGCIEFSSTRSDIYLKVLPVEDHILKRDIIRRCPFIHPSVMFRKSLFLKGLRYPIDTKSTEDYAFWVILAIAGYKFGNIDEALIKFRFEDDVLLRRRGFKKANSEFIARWQAMRQLNCMSIKNVLFALGIWALRLAPTSLAQFAYKKLR